MNKLAVTCAVFLISVGVGFGQTLEWFNNTEAIGPDDNTLPSSDDSSEGSMAQLISSDGDVIYAPSWNFGAGNFEDTDGVQGDNNLTSFNWMGQDFASDGFFFDSGSLSSLGLTTDSYIYVRLWDRPSSDGSGNLPEAQMYTDEDVLNTYSSVFPEINNTPGAFYRDTDIYQVSDLEVAEDQYSFSFGGPSNDGWTFMAIPEPSTTILALLGLGLIGLRRRLLRNS